MSTRHIIFGLSVLALGAGLTGCRGDREDAPPRQFFPDLDDQLKWHPQGQSGFFSDNRMMRRPAAGTVPFGTTEFVPTQDWATAFAAERAGLLKEDKGFFEGVGPDGKYLSTIPVPVTLDMLRHGQEKFNIYCSVCHGYMGDGNGRVSSATNQWAVPVANLLDVKYRLPDPKDPSSELHKDGYLFHTVRYGLLGEGGQPPRMPGYAHALSEADAWAVVGYVRSLQTARNGTLEDVPESAREELRRKRGAVPAASPAAAPSTGVSK